MGVIKKTLTTDAAGDASETFNVHGYVDTIAIDYSATGAAGTDITITGYLEGASFTLYSKTDNITDVVLRPRVKVQDNTGADVLYAAAGEEVHERYMVDKINVTIAQGGDSKVSVVTIGIERIKE